MRSFAESAPSSENAPSAESGARIAVLGTGIMGAGVARSLRRAGFPVTVWNRSIDRAQPLAASGARVAASIAEAVREADIVITTLFDADAVLSVAEQAVATMRADAVWVQASTIGLDGTERVAQLAASHGVSTVEAMMLGTRGPAETGRLVLLVGGDPSLRERLDPVFAAISQKVVWAGETIGRGTALKLVCNAWITTLTAAVGQSLALADGLGLDPNLFLEAIADGQSDTPYAHVKGEAMLRAPGETQFALDGARKDLVLIEEAAGRAGIRDSLVAAVRDLYDRSAAEGHGGEDISAVIAGFRSGDRFAR
jgi:3-hydroxyisobutyrate dehydrogenase